MRVFGLRSFWIPLLAVTAVGMVFGLSLAERRARLRLMRERRAGMVRRLQKLVDRNETLRSERRALLTSPAEIEKVARRDYGFRRQGELVLKTESSSATEGPSRQVSAVGDRWDEWLGRGEFPWRIPGLLFAISAVLFTIVNLVCAREEQQKAA